MNRIVLEGELTFSTVTKVHQQQRDLLHASEQIQVDLQAVTRSDSAGLALLVDWVREAKKRNIHITLSHPPKQMVAMAKLCNLYGLLPWT